MLLVPQGGEDDAAVEDIEAEHASQNFRFAVRTQYLIKCLV